ncbi:MAG TPA: phospholipase D-like domain-containing protein, partial [Burkholderiaceae bacterium]|nr:phospholipase D-like domain-containing protein [Burkholderiaceae bacterium]
RANGAQARIYRPQRGWRLEPRLLRRLHRKIAVVDDGPAFVGGINIIDDYNPADGADSPPGPRFDFAVACDGPIVAAISLATERLWWGMTAAALYPPAGPLPRLARQRRPPTIEGGVRAQLLLRDNFRNRRTIERAYLDAIGRAERDVTIACAYFLPGRRFRAALVAAAARGVRVRLLLQGRVEYAVQHRAQEALYGRLLAAGIEIHAYKPGFLHAKAAVVDGAWATVGSSNIDPFSLLLAREANLCVDDEDFAEQLRAALDRAIDGPSTLVAPADYERRGWIRRALGWAALAFVRLAVSVLARDGDY